MLSQEPRDKDSCCGDIFLAPSAGKLKDCKEVCKGSEGQGHVEEVQAAVQAKGDQKEEGTGTQTLRKPQCLSMCLLGSADE